MQKRCVLPSPWASRRALALALCLAPVASARAAVVAFQPTQIVLADDLCMDLLATGGAKPGVVTVHLGPNRVGMLGNDGAGNLAPVFASSTLPSPRAGALADVDGDGADDLYLMSSTNDRVDLLYRSGAGFVHAASMNPGDAPLAGQAGDFNRNGTPDLACALHNANEFVIVEPDATGALQVVLRYATASKPYDVALGDLNGDGIVDVAMPCYGGNSVTIVLNASGGPIDGPIVRTIPGGARPKALALADFDSDGRLDIARADSQSGRVVIMRQLATSLDFDQSQSIYVGQDPADILTGDFNADGAPDVAVSCGPSFRVMMLINDGQGVFTTQEVPFSFRPWRMASGDLDEDGLTDLVVADQQSEAVAVLINATEIEPVECPGDTNADRRVNLPDLQLLLFDLGRPAEEINGRGTDLNGDGVVNLADLNLLLFNFGAVCGEE